MGQTDKDPKIVGSTEFKEDNSNNVTESNGSKNYSRRDFLKLMGMGAGVLTFGGLLSNLKLFSASAANPFSTLSTPPVNNTSTVGAFATIVVDNILLTTEQSTTVRAFGASNATSSNVWEVRSKPVNGQLCWVGRSMVYTPNVGFTGSDSFTYRVVSGSTVSNTGVVSVNVRNNVPTAPYKYKIMERQNQKTRYTAYDSRDFLSDETRERRFQAVIESYDASFVNQEVTAVIKMNGVSATDRIELLTRTGYPTNNYLD